MKFTAQQLKAKAKAYSLEHDIPVQEVLQNYMLERILVRLSLSVYYDLHHFIQMFSHSISVSTLQEAVKTLFTIDIH
jgi:hypothetical protein